MKWVFVLGGVAMVIIGGIGKYVDMTKYKEPFISGNSPWYTVFMTGVIAVILGLSFDWIMSLDDEEEEGEVGEAGTPADKPAGDEKDADEGEAAGKDATGDEPGSAEDESAEGDTEGGEPKDGGEQPPAQSASDDGDKYPHPAAVVTPPCVPGRTPSVPLAQTLLIHTCSIPTNSPSATARC